MSNTLEIHEPIVAFVTKTQDFVLENLTKVSDAVAAQLPNVPVGPADEFLARGADFADGGLALAGDVLAKNRTFVADLFGVAKTLVSALSEAEVVEMPAKKVA